MPGGGIAAPSPCARVSLATPSPTLLLLHPNDDPKLPLAVVLVSTVT